MPWCLLGIDPARRNLGSFRFSSVVLCVSCSRTTATWLETASCRMTSSLALVRPSALRWSTDRPWFSTVGMTARPEEGASLYLGLSVRWLCGEISYESSVLRISRGGRVEAVVISSFPVLRCCFRALLHFVRPAARPSRDRVSMSTAFISLMHTSLYRRWGRPVVLLPKGSSP